MLKNLFINRIIIYLLDNLFKVRPIFIISSNLAFWICIWLFIGIYRAPELPEKLLIERIIVCLLNNLFIVKLMRTVHSQCFLHHQQPRIQDPYLVVHTDTST